MNFHANLGIRIADVEQVGTGQPATRPELDSEGSNKPQPEIFMLYVYPKNRESDLSPRHLQMLRELVEQHLEQ